MKSISSVCRLFSARRLWSCVALLAAVAFFPVATSYGQAFIVDSSMVPQQYQSYFKEVEDDLNSRIQDYSNELPVALLHQINKLYIVVFFQPAPDGVLGFASPNGLVSLQTGDLFNTKRRTVAVTGSLTINSNAIDMMIAENLLAPVIAHEILHVFGVGSLWAQNDLIGPLNGVGLTQYIGGKYAIEQYRKEANKPFAPFVPIEQFGGPGTALSHWDGQDPFFNQTFTPAFQMDLMMGYACEIRPGTEDELICPPKFFSLTTEGSMADLGFAMYKINPNKTPAPTGTAGRNWPKIVGSGINPFGGGAVVGDEGGGGEPGLSFRKVNIVKVFKKNPKVAGDVHPEENNELNKKDPFNLRNHSWAN